MSGLSLVGLVFVISYLLGKISDLTSSSVRKLAARFHVNEFIASFFFLGVATSVPEIAVAIFSALEGVPQLSFGNLIGANIVVLTLMVGLTALFAGKLSIHRALHKDDFLLTLVITGLPIPFIVNGHVSRIEGLILLVAYGYFLLHFFWRRPAYRRQSDPPRQLRSAIPKDIIIFSGSVVILLILSYVLVRVSLNAAAALGVPVLVVGLLMIAIGTNIPEVSFVFKQMSRRYTKDKNIATGLLLGNVVMNTPTLGLLAFISPFTISDKRAVWVSSAFLLVILYTVWTFILSERKLTRREGVILLLIYGLFAGYELGFFTKFF